MSPHASQLSGQPFDRPSAQRSPIPRIEPVEVGAVGPGQRRKRLVQVLRLEQPSLELGERATDGVGISGEARSVCRPCIAQSAQQQTPFRVSEQAPPRAVAVGERLEHRVEGPDGPGQEATAPFDELALDPFDVGAVRDDQPGIALDRADEPVEKLLDLPGVRRTDDEGEPHRRMVVGWFSRPGLRPRGAAHESRTEREERAGAGLRRMPEPESASWRTSGAAAPAGAPSRADLRQARDLGLRPRRATAAPGIPPAHESTQVRRLLLRVARR